MKCWECGKQIDRADNGAIIYGIKIDVVADNITPQTLEYYNLQLGKYSNGVGECHVALCYECWIDHLLGVTPQ